MSTPNLLQLSDSGSATSYASVNEEEAGLHFTATMTARERHVRELQQLQVALSKPVSELGLGEADTEWQQWMHIQETTTTDNL